jgi:multimeric flavodoxin WrbA
MKKKILVLSGSPRKGGNSDLLCDEFIRGAAECGHTTDKVNVTDCKIDYCRACYYCKNHNGKCAIKDDMGILFEKMLVSDVIVLASPVYFYSINAQLKTVIDRAVAKWTKIKNKDFYYIMTAAENEQSAMECTLECFRGFAACLGGSKEKGVINGGGVYEIGAVGGKPDLLKD